MFDRSIDTLLRSSKRQVRLSYNLRDNVARFADTSHTAIARSHELLASSRARLSCPEASEPAIPALISPFSKNLEANLLPVVSKCDFNRELVSADGKHFSDCTFRGCTLLYSGFPVTFESCRFHDCKFEFSGAAGRTVQFLDCFGLLAGQSTDPSDCQSVDALTQFLN